MSNITVSIFDIQLMNINCFVNYPFCFLKPRLLLFYSYIVYRSDGKEVMVDNKFLKANNPLLVSLFIFIAFVRFGATVVDTIFSYMAVNQLL